ncbi:class D beta-lactamase [Pedobacter sp. PAMC26386]|nr:class D beta-lactamase [Pedobacter sp. PAMC26386]
MKRTVIYLLLLSTCTAYGQTDFKQIFKKQDVEGSITIYNQNKMQWLFSDSLDAIRETLPGATFNLINSCIALETGVVKTENELIRWDGKSQDLCGKEMQEWNVDTDLRTAFKNSNKWFYAEIAKRIGRKDYLEFLTACGYGNFKLTEKGNDFWNSGSFGISPKGQVNFLRVFNREQLPFSPRTFSIVKELMFSGKKEGYILSEKSGWIKSDGKDVGWQIGYVKTKDNVYYFATRITKPLNKRNPGFAKAGKEITMDVFKQIKIIN